MQPHFQAAYKYRFTDENVETIDFDEECDFAGISMMLSTQVKRGLAISAEFRKRGKKVIFGGIATMLHAEETSMHADKLQELYDYAWTTFYADESQESKMMRLFTQVMMREMEDGTY